MQTKAPSIKSLVSSLGITEDKAKLVRSIIKGETKLRDLPPEHFPSTNAWIDSCHNIPPNREIRLEALNELIGGYGVEAIGDCNCYPPNIKAEYINTGDTYSATILRVNATGTYRLTTWGDFVEHGSHYPGITTVQRLHAGR